MAKDPYKYFIPEAHDLLSQLGQGVLDLERRSADAGIVRHLLRVAHTLKGAARVVKQKEVGDGAHAIEDLLTPFRESGSVPADRIESLLRIVDDIGGQLAGLVSAVNSPQPSPDEAPRAQHAPAELDAVLDGLAECRTHLASVRTAAQTIGRVRDLSSAVLTHVMVRSSRSDVGTTAPELNAPATVHELQQVIARAERELSSSVDHLDRELRQVRQTAEQLRLVPAVTIFTALERTVRDAAQVARRSVRFEGAGGDVRVEGHVLAAVQRASVQLMRNAVAHGIEPESVRGAHGKPPAGRVAFHVSRRASQVVFRIEDDGQGMDLAAVRRSVAHRGLSEAETQRLGAEDLVRELLRGGLSTAAEVTAIAGRGIGLDIVRETVAKLKGTATVVTNAGIGTAFELIVPVSMASLEALIVTAGGATAAIPLDAVRQTLRFGVEEISRTSHADSIVFGARVIPFVPLSEILRLPSVSGRTDGRRSAIVVAGAKGLAAIGVERCVGAERIVVRPMPELMAVDAVAVNFYIDAEGNPQLVLDPDALIEAASKENVHRTAYEARPPRPVLIVDDSLTTRMLEQSILASAGYEVDTVTSAEEALVSASQKPYALYLVDVEMPGMDGFTFIERLRADAALRDVPAILITSRASAEDRQRGYDVGAQGYIVKSEFNQGQLLARIKELVG
jgi:two-component system chemotaxis sensor kinase CheA